MKDEWSSSTAYERLDGVMYDGSLWIALADNTNSTPSINNSNWMLSAKHGEFTEQQLEDFKAEVVAESKEEMDEYTSDKKDELDTYTSGLESDFNTNASSKTTDFNNNATSKTGDFDSNASSKTTAFNTNASDKTTAFNSNATSKTSDFNDNASSKTNAFNSNATEKTTAFDNNASAKTTAFNENATSKTTDFNTNATSKTGDFNDNATAKTTAFDEHVNDKINEFDEHAESLQQEIDELSANMPWTETEQATSIDITDAAKYSKNKMEVFGNTEQDDTKITYKCDGTETGDYYLTYNSISYYFTMPTIESGNILIFDTTELKLYLDGSEITTSTSGTGTELTFVSSPNPNYPQLIHVVTGNNTVKVEGSNIFDEQIELGTIDYSNGNNSNSSTIIRSKNYIPISSTFTIIAKETFASAHTLGFRYYDKNYNYIGRVTKSQFTNYATINPDNSLDTSKTVAYMRFLDTSANGDATEKFAIRIDNGTAYEPYYHQEYPINLGTLELCKIENYQDTIFKNTPDSEYYDSSLVENGWYKYGAIRKYTEAISATITESEKYRGVVKTRANLHDMTSTTNVYIGGKSKNSVITDSTSTSKISYNYGWGGLAILYSTSDSAKIKELGNIETTADFRAWFNANEILYIPINTDYDDIDITQITDTTLIAQLEAIYNHLVLTKGINHITISATPQDLAPYVTLNYMQDLPSKLNNLASRIELLEE